LAAQDDDSDDQKSEHESKSSDIIGMDNDPTSEIEDSGSDDIEMNISGSEETEATQLIQSLWMPHTKKSLEVQGESLALLTKYYPR